MAGSRGKVLLAGLVLLAATAPAQAWWGWRWGYGRVYYGPAYFGPAYYAPTCYYAPVYPVYATVIPVAAPTAMPPAKKSAEPIPGATGKEPPVLGDTPKKGPIITESRSLRGYAQVGAKERCKVGFWNLTGRDVTLKIDGQQRLLARDRAVTLELDRSFAWQIDQGQTVSERVPEEQPFHEVILRQ